MIVYCPVMLPSSSKLDVCVVLVLLMNLWQGVLTSDLSNFCSPDEFDCQDSTGCIPEDWECDGISDCEESGIDEHDGCSHECATGNFECVSENKCIPQDWVCDYFPDCADQSDEKQNCPPCSGFTCGISGMCLEERYVCDSC